MTANMTLTAPRRERRLWDAEIVTPLASSEEETNSRGIPFLQRTLLYRGQDGGFWTRRWAEPPCERTRIDPIDHVEAEEIYAALPVKLAPLRVD